MFKIARSVLCDTHGIGSPVLRDGDQELLGQFCFSEGWSADLSNGLFQLGEGAASLHGLSQSECGLLNLVRCYDNADRNHVLELFEQAATTSARFCFSTTIILASGHKQPVFCVGESNGLEQQYSGSLVGVFLFPRFQLDAKTRIFNQHQ